MRAIRFENAGNADVIKLVEESIPQLRPHDLLVRVRAAGLNRADILQRQGFYGQQPDFGDSVIPGLEIAGEVVDVGAAATGFRNGDRVMAIVGGGAHAEYARVDSRMAMAIWIKPASVFQVGQCGSPCMHIYAEYAEVRGMQFRSSSSRLTEMPG